MQIVYNNISKVGKSKSFECSKSQRNIPNKKKHLLFKRVDPADQSQRPECYNTFAAQGKEPRSATPLAVSASSGRITTSEGSYPAL